MRQLSVRRGKLDAFFLVDHVRVNGRPVYTCLSQYTSITPLTTPENRESTEKGCLACIDTPTYVFWNT